VEISNHLWENVRRFKQKGLKLTTIAIIGGGIAARSLLYMMAKKNIRHKILVFYSDSFAFPCSLHSTAIVAPRGISTGHSALGDELVYGFERFVLHVMEDCPEGVIKVPQYTGALTKIEAFQKRYPAGKKVNEIGPVGLNQETYFAQEMAYMIRPLEYMDWLLCEAKKVLDLEIVPSFVTEINEGKIKTQEGKEYSADKIIFTAGVNNDLWSGFFSENKKSKSAQGSYLEFQKVHLGKESFSLTLEGNNCIYDSERCTLLVGSTTKESNLELAPEKELYEVYQHLQQQTKLVLPDFKEGLIQVGLREKAQKREAYLLNNGPYSAIGGLYKNGYRLGIFMAEKLLSSSTGM
jgi:hypothetical protein